MTGYFYMNDIKNKKSENTRLNQTIDIKFNSIISGSFIVPCLNKLFPCFKNKINT